MTIAVTFDFHDTLATCDQWFEVEVFTLVPSVLAVHDRLVGTEYAFRHGDDAGRMYRELRAEVIRCGVEQNALSCTRAVIERLEIPFNFATLSRTVDEVMRATLPGTTPVAGALEAVRFLAEQGVAVGVVSSAVHHQFLEWTLDSFGVADQITTIVTSASSGYYKSRTEIYESAVHALGVAPERCVHIGDSHEYDVVTAARAGLRTVWYRRGRGSPEDHSADLVVDSLVGVAPRALDLLERHL